MKAYPCEGQPALVLTGFTRNGSEKGFSDQYLVRVFGKEVWLTYGPFILLIDLVVGRVTSGTGRLFGCRPDVIWKLRRALDRDVGPGVGDALIVTVGGGKQVYCLAVKRGDIARDPSFDELPNEAVSAETKRVLRKPCRAHEGQGEQRAIGAQLQ